MAEEGQPQTTDLHYSGDVSMSPTHAVETGGNGTDLARTPNYPTVDGSAAQLGGDAVEAAGVLPPGGEADKPGVYVDNPASKNPRENHGLAWKMAYASKDKETAAAAAGRAGRTETAERLRKGAEADALNGAKEYDREKFREAEDRVIELRVKERDLRAEEMRKHRLEEEINGFVDKVLETVDLPPGNKVEILDQFAGLPAYDVKVDELYRRLGLERPAEDAEPHYIWDSSKGGPSHMVGKRQAEQLAIFRTPTGFGKDIVETRYLPGHQYQMSEQVRITVEDEQKPDSR